MGNVEKRFDTLTVNGKEMTPGKVHGIEPTGVMSWRTDTAITNTGWKLCARSEPTPEPTSETTSTPTPTSEPAQKAAAFTINSGEGCTLDPIDKRCITTRNYPAKYGNNEKCTFVLNPPA